MSKSKGTDPDAINFSDLGSRNKPRFAYKGGLGDDSGVLSGLIEPEINEENKIISWEKFLTKRRIGGKKINGRKIKGWKEVPTVLKWNSTYRQSEWIKNFKKVYEILKEKGITGLINTGNDLNGKEKEHNHAVNVFLNAFFTKEMRFRSYENIPEVEELIEYLTFKPKVLLKHSRTTYLNDDYQSQRNKKTRKVVINGEEKSLIYGDFKIHTYQDLLDQFFEYIEMMEDMNVYQADLSGEQYLQIDPSHRWEEAYTNKMLAKFKDLEESKFAEMWTTMLTLTTYQDTEEGEPETPKDWKKRRGASWFEAMERLKDSLEKTLNILRQVARRELEEESTFHYAWVVEAHKSGYPHIHVAIFGDVSEWLDEYKNQLRIKDILEKEHDIGKNGIATEIDTKPPAGEGAINNLSNYLMKYFKKNFGEIKSKYHDEDLSDKDRAELIYNACMWVSGYMTWGTSKEVGEVMKSESSESEKDYKHLGGELTERTDDTFENIVSDKGSEELKYRLEKRKEFRKAVKQRYN